MRYTWAEVDLEAIAANLRALGERARSGSPGRPGGPQLMAVVKADAYGHGALEVARAALAAGASWLAVAIVEEGVALRQAGFEAPILVLGFVPPEQAGLVVEHGLRTALYQADLAAALSREAVRRGKPARVHVKVDTGMGRLGLAPSEVIRFIRVARSLPGLEVEGLFTHFATADSPDKSYAREQASRLGEIVSELNARGMRPLLVHAANSAAAIDLPEYAFDLVRLGIAMYGLNPAGVPVPSPGGFTLHPALNWKARFSHVKVLPPGSCVSYGCTYRTSRTTPIGTLPVGYADGFSRRWSNRGEVLVRGARVPVVGRVCMDPFMVDLSPVWREGDPVRVGEEAVLLGNQGAETISAEAWGEALDTINYEVVCLISARVPRVYRRGGEVLEVDAGGGRG